ncbi:hypothetical protein [Brevibacterium linens]|uniref:Uncharacterized protein n=1 Tax=Brevibacterium linens TaxID=1703 RepID=A0A2H1J9W1_BRELN|nr:hypothetical protein [Brevibacterium linens]SMX83942.1 hypothetical protein BLIN101_02067 [Brevibacterium linens]
MRFLVALILGLAVMFGLNALFDFFSMSRPLGSILMGATVGVTMLIVLLIWEVVRPTQPKGELAKAQQSEEERAQARADRRARLAAEAGVSLEGIDGALPGSTAQSAEATSSDETDTAEAAPTEGADAQAASTEGADAEMSRFEGADAEEVTAEEEGAGGESAAASPPEGEVSEGEAADDAAEQNNESDSSLESDGAEGDEASTDEERPAESAKPAVVVKTAEPAAPAEPTDSAESAQPGDTDAAKAHAGGDTEAGDTESGDTGAGADEPSRPVEKPTVQAGDSSELPPPPPMPPSFPARPTAAPQADVAEAPQADSGDATNDDESAAPSLNKDDVSDSGSASASDPELEGPAEDPATLDPEEYDESASGSSLEAPPTGEPGMSADALSGKLPDEADESADTAGQEAADDDAVDAEAPERKGPSAEENNQCRL